ncbi:hypothetical protein [Salinactinospora qingdaonensis]|uniref:DUF4276 family protein n=1 Tax=Salinactinospora qingdaonensis TaxID=702744 RepID=A0ABP7EXJ0_9ACTN
MSPRGGTRRKAVKKPVVVVAGEDRNDRQSLRALLEAICPHMSGRIVEISDDVRLRQATGSRLSQRVKTLAGKIKARAQRENTEVACVFVHEDLDGVDSENYLAVHEKVERELHAHLGSAHYVLAVAEMEAWLLLFPHALRSVVSTWQVPVRFRGKDTGKIADPKKVLMQDVPKKGGRRYSESDAPKVFSVIANEEDLGSPMGSNRSWNRFCEDAEQCGQRHVPAD